MPYCVSQRQCRIRLTAPYGGKNAAVSAGTSTTLLLKATMFVAPFLEIAALIFD